MFESLSNISPSYAVGLVADILQLSSTSLPLWEPSAGVLLVRALFLPPAMVVELVHLCHGTHCCKQQLAQSQFQRACPSLGELMPGSTGILLWLTVCERLPVSWEASI